MSKKVKQYRFRCPICGLVPWQKRLQNQYPLEIIDVYSSGRGLIKNVYLPWADQPLCRIFENHFYDVLTYLLRNRYVDADVVKQISDVYTAKKAGILFPRHVQKPKVVYHPKVVYRPKLVKNI